MFRLIRFSLFLLLVFIIFSSCNRTTKKESLKPNLPDIKEYYPDGTISKERLKVYNDLFSPILKKTNFNGSVLVALNGYIIYQYNNGFANYETSTPITDSTLFQIASLTKIFTSAAIMLLVEENKISLDDKVSKYIDNLIYKDITIRQLLQHRSGLPRYEFFENEFWQGISKDYNKCVLNKLNTDSIPYYFKPDSRFIYSNTGYVLLALIIEKVSKMSYEDFLTQRIFIPSNMNNTRFSTRISEIDNRRRAIGYYNNRRSSGRWQISALDSVLGDKGIYSTSLDLLNWYRSVYLKRVLTYESIEQTQDIIPNNTNKDRGYGLGIRWKRVDDREFYYHNGRWNGFRSSYVFRPDTKLLVIVLSNTSHSASRISNSIIDVYDAKIKKLRIRDNNQEEDE